MLQSLCVSFISGSSYFSAELGRCSVSKANRSRTLRRYWVTYYSIPLSSSSLRCKPKEYVAKNGNNVADCSEATSSHTASDGVYVIRAGVSDDHRTARVYCQRDHVDSTGWTVIQRRVDGSQSFARGWDDYAMGFGEAAGDYWLGNEYVHQLTNRRPFRLRVDMWDVQGRYWVADYPSFRVASSDELYRLDLGRPSLDEDAEVPGM